MKALGGVEDPAEDEGEGEDEDEDGDEDEDEDVVLVEDEVWPKSEIEVG